MRLRAFLFAALAMPLVASCYDVSIEGPEPVSVFSITTSVPTLNLRQDDTTSFTVSVRNETRAQAISAIGAFAESDGPVSRRSRRRRVPIVSASPRSPVGRRASSSRSTG